MYKEGDRVQVTAWELDLQRTDILEGTVVQVGNGERSCRRARQRRTKAVPIRRGSERSNREYVSATNRSAQCLSGIFEGWKPNRQFDTARRP